MSKSDLINSEVESKLRWDGFAIVPRVVHDSLRVELIRDIEASVLPSTAGLRGLTTKIDSVAGFANSPRIRELVEPVLGQGARLVRSILFNKTEEANWQVAWHQDLSIAVQKRVEIDGFVSWSDKDGTPHVQPPVEILEQMLNVRVHLDAADETNGALWVSPGSHRLGRVPADLAAAAAKRLGTRSCGVAAGDALLFRPLTLHASRKAKSNRPRRVIHLEFAGISLPAPLEWAEAAAR
jgi:ectoine hydroxylase-related dioxygenase (phytanoyl-CoA dioxygenase family)